MAMTPEERQELLDLREEVERLKEDGRPLTAGDRKFLQNNVVFYRAETSNSPTADGYIDVEINGRRYTLLTGS